MGNLKITDLRSSGSGTIDQIGFGEYFIYDKNLYMKMFSIRVGECNAVNLKNGNVAYFHDQIIEKINNIEFIIKD